MVTTNDCDERTALLEDTKLVGIEEERRPDGVGLSTSSSSATICDVEEIGQIKPSAPRRPFPWKPVLSILSLAVVQPLAFELIFPFINQMILENGIVNDPERVGFYSGLIESLFAFTGFLSVLPCSYLSDHIGRKPVILLGTAGMAVSIAMFGMAKSYWTMIITRCAGGVLGGVFSAIKVMLAEITEKSEQGKALSGFSIAYRMGQIVGQPIGGLLSHPERNIPFFDTPFWNEYPFALPCFISAGFAVFALIFGALVIEETAPGVRRRRARAKYASTVTQEPGSGESSPERTPVSVQHKIRQRPSLRSVLTPHVISAYVSCFALAITSETIFAVYPLFAFTPIASGGLGLSEAKIGAHMASRSFVSILVMFFYTPIERRLGVLRMYSFSMFFFPVCVVFFPVLNAMARAGLEGTWLFDGTVVLFFTTWSVGNFGWTGSGIILNDAAPSAEALAVINGMGQMSLSLAMAFAPVFITTLFAFTVEYNLLGGNLTWVVLFIIGILSFVHTLILKDVSHDWRQDLKDELEESS